MTIEPTTEPIDETPDPVDETQDQVDQTPAPARYEQVRFLDVVMVLPSTNAVVVLEEVSPPCRLIRIPVGPAEGSAIAFAARGIDTPKPLTHELFSDTLTGFGITVDFVRITAVHENAFSAEIVMSGSRGSRTIRCRASDGIALALRQPLGAPIIVAPEVLDEVGRYPAQSSDD